MSDKDPSDRDGAAAGGSGAADTEALIRRFVDAYGLTENEARAIVDKHRADAEAAEAAAARHRMIEG